MNPFDLDQRWKLPETLVHYILLIQRLGRLRRLAEHHPLVRVEYQRVRVHKQLWEALR